MIIQSQEDTDLQKPLENVENLQTRDSTNYKHLENAKEMKNTSNMNVVGTKTGKIDEILDGKSVNNDNTSNLDVVEEDNQDFEYRQKERDDQEDEMEEGERTNTPKAECITILVTKKFMLNDEEEKNDVELDTINYAV